MTVDPTIQAAADKIKADVDALVALIPPTPVPVPVPPPAPTPTPSPADVIFDGSFASGKLDSSLYPHQSYVAGHVTVVDDPDGSGVKVARFAIANSDQPYSGSHPRGDLMTPPAVCGEGKTLFCSVSTKLATPVPLIANDASSFFQVAQCKDIAAAHCSWGLGVIGKQWALGVLPTSRYGYTPVWLGPIVDDKWHTMILEVLYTAKPAGTIRLWFDELPVTFNNGAAKGEAQLTGIATIGDTAPGWPIDIDCYRASNIIPGTVELYHGPLKIGRTFASVAPSTPTGP